MKKILIVCLILIGITSVAEAHVTVKPSQVGVGSYQTFSIGVPVEKNIPTTGLTLVIPNGLEHVTPNVKPGWTIVISKEGEGEATKVTQITWSGGSIPPGLRDEFYFSAKVPAGETTLPWKAYQLYSSGEIVAWDQDPTTNTNEEVKPFSVTQVVDDLATGSLHHENSNSGSSNTFGILAFVFSLVALVMSIKNNRQL